MAKDSSDYFVRRHYDPLGMAGGGTATHAAPKIAEKIGGLCVALRVKGSDSPLKRVPIPIALEISLVVSLPCLNQLMVRGETDHTQSHSARYSSTSNPVFRSVFSNFV